jgi:hypothetical protein
MARPTAPGNPSEHWTQSWASHRDDPPTNLPRGQRMVPAATLNVCGKKTSYQRPKLEGPSKWKSILWAWGTCFYSSTTIQLWGMQLECPNVELGMDWLIWSGCNANIWYIRMLRASSMKHLNLQYWPVKLTGWCLEIEFGSTFWKGIAFLVPGILHCYVQFRQILEICPFANIIPGAW